MSYELEEQGAILYALVAKGSKILAEYTQLKGNFPTIAVQILEQVPQQNGKRTCAYEVYHFHYEVHNEITYMCMTDQHFSKVQAYKFLKHIRGEWKEKFGDKGKTAKMAYAMNKEFKGNLKKKMDYFNNDPNADKIRKTKVKISKMRENVIKTIDDVMESGDQLDNLADKTTLLNETTYQFKSKSSTIKRQLWWRNIMITVIIAGLILAAGMILFVYLCGGVTCLINLFKSAEQPKQQQPEQPKN
mmetsp:Transcript_4760/g.7044  ORF Transcript_4760/g.7044 Transcript_4760/m.7044 type:complete len:245 (+) Transcript_4760:47-781(+)